MPSDSPAYVKARVIAGLALIGLVVVLFLVGAANTAYKVDSIQLGLLLGTAGLFLGVEGLKKLLR